MKTHNRLFTQSIAIAMLLLLAALQPLSAQITLQANGSGNTYEDIEAQFGDGTASEVPDCSHTAFGRHISETFDSDLGKNVFVFHIHADIDNDRCTNFDRQRNEIKGGSGSPAGLKHTQGETAYCRWKFKLDAGFVPSSRFTHIMQIKALDGDAGAPLMTLTPRAGSPQKMEVIHSAGEGTGSQGKIAEVDLAPFKGTWVEAYMEYRSSEGSAGTFTMTIRRISDGATLLSVTRTGIDMWRTGASYNRPKWGIYRGLDDVLRDEQVRFADFCVSESSASQCPSSIGSVTPPAAPTNLTATAISGTQINLAWTDNANNEGLFRIERSLDGGSTWSNLTTTPANTTTFSNTGLTASTTYHYRVRAENTAGNSAFSNTANATTPGGTLPSIGVGTTQAESLNKSGFENNTFEGAACVRAISTTPGFINGTFTGATGTYNLTLRVFDENDGATTLTAKVNGSVVGTRTLSTNDHTWKDWVISGVSISNGHEVRIEGAHQAGEHARIDYLQVASTAGPQEIYIEAEAGSITTPMQILQNTSASGGQYISVAPGNNSSSAAPATGRATYTFSVATSGTYKVWGRVIAPVDTDDSFWVRMDGGTWINWNNITLTSAWAWDDVHNAANANTAMTYTLAAGNHTLDIAYREDGTQLDRLLITNNLSLNPNTSGASAARIATEAESPADDISISAFPNPSAGQVTVVYKVTQTSQVTLSLYDGATQKTSIITDEKLSPGTYTTAIDTRQLSQGVHVIRIVRGQNISTYKLLKQ